MRFFRSVARLLNDSFAVGAILSGVFYFLVTRPEMQGTLLHKYTTEHVTEYAIVVLLFWGLADMLQKCVGFRAERRALAHDWLPACDGPESPAAAAGLLERLGEAPPALANTRLARRLRQALFYVSQRGAADGLSQQLRDLSERDDAQTHANYAVPRFEIWVTPVMGFLGTVVHFGSALTGFAPDELVERLPEMAGGLGAGFNTTCMALSVSMSSMCLMFFVERAERGIVGQVDDWIERRIAHRFAESDVRLAPFLHAVEAATQATLAAVERTNQRQAIQWEQGLGELLRSQESLEKVRTGIWNNVAEQQRQLQQQEWADRNALLGRWLQELGDDRAAHRADLAAAAERLTSVDQSLARTADLLAQALASEGRLLDVQHGLNDNLRALQETKHFEETMHSLAAAVHLLTARQTSHGTKAA